MIAKKKKRWIDALFYIILTMLVGSLLYNHYLILVDQGKAESIEYLKKRVIQEMASKYDSINHRDSIIWELKDSINILTPEITE
jgi:hypothetical protein